MFQLNRMFLANILLPSICSLLCGCHSTSHSTENATPLKNHPAYSVFALNHCGENISAEPKTYRLFADYEVDLQNQVIPNLTGWNHTSNGNTDEWKSLSLNAAEYNNPNKGNANESCNDIDTLDMILLKKYADWNHQHSNGFEFHIPAQTIYFEQIKSIVIDLKIHSAKTILPSMPSLENTYSPYVPAGILKELDSSLVNIGFTFSDDTTLKASTIIELDQNLLFDRWIRVKINMRDLRFYSEINYVETKKTFLDLHKSNIRSVLVEAETRAGGVLRNHIDSWNPTTPETFKEINLSFKKIEFMLK
jgi:hypothetical protein